ncbi:hypothetical protein DYBT9275_00423 [Dyadobacter sp. CECT 9275]|uniref:Uncharacterized protein n=1 Tax=Dyadobacter helix TaxID=2822344 RepID=A0A916N2G4_9BACT|nr:hypothetical protein [Dyadobacter sp. CECT 9275]CAG4989993.1 hypothetical protein DYBT9275_00423 [Dyadobacter sp. CECT 9275]
MDIYQLATAFWDPSPDQEEPQESIQNNLSETEKRTQENVVISLSEQSKTE